MAKVSGSYEVLYVLNPTLGEEDTAALVARFKELAEGRGSVTEVDEWGKRRLAYPINYKNDGYYVLMSFSADPAFPAELDRLMRINVSVMRSIIVSKDA
jgi:small subunit ribosomal protein S6